MYFTISFHVSCLVLFILQYTKVLKEFLTKIIESNKTHNNMVVMRVAKEEGCKRGEKRYGNWNFALWFYF